MKRLGTALYETFAAREWTQEERDSIEDVLDAAAAFTEFRLPLADALAVGQLPTGDGQTAGAAYARYRAMLAAHPDDPRRAALAELLNVVIAAQPGVMTHKGFFFHEDLRGTGIVVRSRKEAA